jgi:hypothetical protein
LVKHIDQSLAVRALHQTVGTKLLVAPAANAFGVGAQQHVDNMLGAEALAGTRHAREDLLRGDGRISEAFHFVETEIARRAVSFGVLLPEVFGELAVPAMSSGAKSTHVFEQVASRGDHLAAGAGLGGAFFDQRFQRRRRRRVKHHALRL